MEIKKLILSRNKRLSVKHINYIEINPTNPVQLILGTNGVGKSTVIFECTPLPANSNDYHKDGYKEIHLLHDGHMYVCRSTFDPKQHHSITEDGEELNKGGTIGVQKEIILQKFGISQEIHEILTMQMKFTNMPTGVRRYWFTKLANADYNYVISVYNKLKTKHQDIASTVKTLKKRLVLETEKIVDIDYQNALQLEVDTLHVSLSQLLEIRKPMEETPEEMQELEKANTKNLLDVSNQLIRSIRSNRQITTITFEEIEDCINSAIATQRSGAVLSDQYLKEISKLDESISALEKTGQNNVQDLLGKILRLQLSQSEITKEETIPIPDTADTEQLVMALTNVEPTLLDLADNLPPNPNKIYSRLNYAASTNLVASLTQDKLRLETDLKDLQARQKHQELHLNTEGVQCPKCSFKWHLGYSEQAHKEVIANIEEKSMAHGEIVKAIEEAQRNSTEILDYFAQFKRYTQLTDNWKILDSLWQHLEKGDVLMRAPSNIPHVLQRYARAIQLKAEYNNYQKQIDETRVLVNLAEQVLHLDIDKLKERREELDAQLFKVSQEINTARNKQNEQLRLKSDKLTVDKLTETVKTLVGERQLIQDQTVEAVRRKLFNECVRNIQTSLSRKELAISEIRGQRAIITDIEHQIRFLTSDEQSLKLLVQELSPTDGLIAEGIFGFIKVFVKHMNAMIEKVWTYPLVIQACDMEEGEGVDLDYKFPVDNGETKTPDVSRCSAGQVEIINWTFMVQAQKHLGLGKNPLMLDEFAVNLDNVHRIAATNLVKSLIEKHSFSQLFMVNHYDSIYGAFTNAEVTVMCEENVVLPKDCVFNKHAIIR